MRFSYLKYADDVRYEIEMASIEAAVDFIRSCNGEIEDGELFEAEGQTVLDWSQLCTQASCIEDLLN